MNQNINFDIILPTLCKETLVRSIESVMVQSYGGWKLYVMSDGYDVETSNISIPYDSRIKYFYLPDGPHNDCGAYARNTGIELSENEYICYIDDDDIWLRDHLSIMREIIIDHDRPDIICTSGQEFRMKRRHRLSKELVKRDGQYNHTDIMTIGLCHKRDPSIQWNGLNLNNHDKELWDAFIKAGKKSFKSSCVTFQYER